MMVLARLREVAAALSRGSTSRKRQREEWPRHAQQGKSSGARLFLGWQPSDTYSSTCLRGAGREGYLVLVAEQRGGGGRRAPDGPGLTPAWQ